MRIVPRKEQINGAKVAVKNLRKYAIHYIAWEERTGKSLTGLLAIEDTTATHCLIITKAKAKKDWYQLLLDYPHNKVYELITYGMVSKYRGKPDIIILDEAHNYISGYPKPSATWKSVRKLIFGLPIIYMSATPHAQGLQLLYHQLALSKWSPFNMYSNFYTWFKVFGEPYTIKVGSYDRPQYDRVNVDKVRRNVDHLFDTKTRKELGFKHEPEDSIKWIELDHVTKDIYNKIVEDNVLVVAGNTVLYDSTMKLRSGLHMIEGGTIKLTLSHRPAEDIRLIMVSKENTAPKGEPKAYLYHCYYELGNIEKISYIKGRWGDNKNVAIMYNYKGEKIILERHFKNAQVLQATSNAEGVELSHIRHLVIYSQDFSTARHTQRRARQASKSRQHEIDVNFLLVKKGISHQVYKTVSLNKKNFVDSRFKREVL